MAQSNTNDKNNHPSIAIFRALNLGDMLCIIPTVRAIRSAYPEAVISLIGLPWQKEFVQRFNMYFDEFIEFPGWPGLPEQVPDGARIFSFLQRIRKRQFDLILQMQGNGILTNSMCLLWNGKQLCGLRKSGEYAPDEKMFPVSEDSDHEILRFTKLLDCLSIPHQGTELEFPIRKEERATLAQILQQFPADIGQYICIHPGARDPLRRWPAENFVFIANQLIIRGYKVLLTGSLAEKDLLKDLQQRIEGSVFNIVETFGQVGIGELAHIIQHAACLLSNDTGVSHVAAALKVPSVILFSPRSTYSRWRPLDSGRHDALPAEKNSDPAYVLERLLSHIEKMRTSDLRNTLARI